ncbi:hypothetical protein BO94DRAFT_142784 [Aspergillus sclerotioniger CBS 115572]|uniref:Endonuclease/exonuclease/phosphatase domain-containing protein n=1 Tax=Aspergillus sclerotioniger CBS 115572 TaxID=1450535 RepID=A0A317XED9_9EURO|nr:hypothetical protein BO94DRAFT_142784 [Aspergillus sclerotioniger CBS 115572]PWY96007.1 hypothetical protein BO94DRAFT_142784 [Aspergillus sclerotioniger CBS 115572]
MIVCKTAPAVHADSDHLPIATIIDLDTPLARSKPGRDWKAMNTKKMREFVKANMEGVAAPGRGSNPCVDQCCHGSSRGNDTTGNCGVNPGSTPECREAVKTTKRTRRAHKRERTDEKWKE